MTELDDYLKPLLSLADAVIVTDDQHRIIAINKAYEKITGYSASDILGKKAGLLKSSLTPLDVYQDMKKHIHNDLPWSGVFTNRKKDKTLWHSSITITPYHVNESVIFVGIFRELEKISSGAYLPEERIQYIQGSILKVLAISCEIRDPGIEQHLLNVKQLTEELVTYHNDRLQLGLSSELTMHIANASILHDVGKSGVPEGILYKPGKLTDYERKIVELHSHIGADIVEKIYSDFNDSLFTAELLISKNIVLYHHEKWNGTGYPMGLAGKEIPIEAQIVSIVDVYDALTSARPYKEKWSSERALHHIRNEKGKHFNPDIADSFLEMMKLKSESFIHSR